jgi:hypothetical protein
MIEMAFFGKMCNFFAKLVGEVKTTPWMTTRFGESPFHLISKDLAPFTSME